MEELVTAADQRRMWVSVHVEDPRAAEAKAAWKAYAAWIADGWYGSEWTPRTRLALYFSKVS